MRNVAIPALFLPMLFCLNGCVNDTRTSDGTSSDLNGMIPAAASLLELQTDAYPLTLGFRPHDESSAKVNPPRFSWKYHPEMKLPESEKATEPLRRFRFQVSTSDQFADPAVDVDTDINFYNALQPLPAGTWYWRVGYHHEQGEAASEAGESAVQELTWSGTRSFTVTEDTPKWDRSGITGLADKLGTLPHPRLGPTAGDWQQITLMAQEDPLLRKLAFLTVQEAQHATEQDWWKQGLPDTDQLGNPWKLTRTDRLQFNTMAKGIANAAFAWKLTGNEQFAKAKDLLIDFTQYKPGGLSSPEWHGNPHKFGTETIKFLAFAYDWLYHDLSEEERSQVRTAVEWRLEKVFYQGKSWASDGKIEPLGMAMKNGSHPYQNAMWSVPALLILAGESDMVDRTLPMVVNYMLGVGASQGPEEAYNEGAGYGDEKGGVLLDAMVALDMLAPELELEKNPQLIGLGDWFLQLFPIGFERLSWGDSWSNPIRQQVLQVYNHYKLAWLTQEGRYRHRAEELQAWRFHGSRIPVIHDPWFKLLAFHRLELPDVDAGSEKTAQIFPTSGWMFAGSHAPSDWRNREQAIQLQMQARPMGRSSHSYHAEGSFVWHAYGKTLSAGGDTLKFMNPYCKETEAHSGLLVNGKGIQYQYGQIYYESDQPAWTARPVAWETGEDYVYWAVDLTPGYYKQAGVTRVIRHVAMLKERVFVLYDELKVQPGDTVSWLMKLPQRVPVEVSAQEFRFTVDEVHAQVFHTGAEGLELLNLAGREGYLNPVTNFDWGPDVNKGMQRMARTTLKGQADPDADYLENIEVWNNFWANRTAGPDGSVRFLSALVAWKGEAAPTVTELSPQAMKFAWPEGESISVSFDPAQQADITIDPAKIP